MNRILEIDLPNEEGCGAARRRQSRRERGPVEADGYFFAPDPSSQRRLLLHRRKRERELRPARTRSAYGVTTNHVLRAGGGARGRLGDRNRRSVPDLPGYDLTGLLVGSEGTMALVTKIVVRLMRKPEMVKTILAIYDRTEDAGDTVTEITARCVMHAGRTVEMLDGLLLRMESKKPRTPGIPWMPRASC